MLKNKNYLYYVTFLFISIASLHFYNTSVKNFISKEGFSSDTPSLEELKEELDRLFASDVPVQRAEVSTSTTSQAAAAQADAKAKAQAKAQVDAQLAAQTKAVQAKAQVEAQAKAEAAKAPQLDILGFKTRRYLLLFFKKL
jgi:preprotein translocase subunit SecF